MVCASLAFFAGTLLAWLWPAQASPYIVPVLALVCAAGVWLHVRGFMSPAHTARRAVAICAPMLALCAGLAWELFSVHAALGARWPVARNDERVLVTARVDGLPARRSSGLTFDAFLVADTAPSARRLHARLLWRDAPALQPGAGETWRLLVTLHAPKAAVNPGSADGERQLFRDRIDAIGTVVGSSRLNKRLAACASCLDTLRARIAAHIRRVVDDRDAGALIAALAVGATGEMSSDQWRIFAATGTTHLVAISGSHVTMFALAAMLVARLLWRYALAGRIAMARESFAAAFGLAAAAAYAALAGLSVPTLRTLLMLAAWQLSAAGARSITPLAPLCASLVVILLFDPFAALSSGFWLSFAAIAVIGIVGAQRLGVHGRILAPVRVQIALFLALAPLTLAWFGSLSLAGLLVNAIAIPAIGCLLVPMVLTALALTAVRVQLSDAMFALAARLCELIWPALQTIGDGPLAQVHLQPPWWWPAIAGIACVIVLLPWPPVLRVVVLLGVAVLAAPPPGPRAGMVEVTVLDVGDATAVIARTANHALAYGLGDRVLGEGGSVHHVLVPFLQSVGVRRIDLAILGHAAARGSPGLTALLAAVPVARVGLADGLPLDFPQARRCSAESRWFWDGVLFEMRAPASGCIVRIVAGGETIVLASEGEPLASLPLADAIVLRTMRTRLAARRQILSTARPAPALTAWTTGASGALQLTLGAAAAASAPLEWRARLAGPWRVPACLRSDGTQGIGKGPRARCG